MHLKTSILISTAIFFSATYSVPVAGPFLDAFAKGAKAYSNCEKVGPCDDDSDPQPDPGTAPARAEQTTCSAKSSIAETLSWAEEPAWVSSMNACVGKLNVDHWTNPDEDHAMSCMPQRPDGTRVGDVSFGFYSKGEEWHNTTNCYDKCHSCLEEGIGNHQAVTTYCRYQAGEKSWCEMGFVWGG